MTELNRVDFKSRLDTKFITNAHKLNELLALMVDDYFVMEIDGQRQFKYYNVYYDSEDMNLYTKHHAGRLTRTKVRFRRYDKTGPSFIEIKNKNNKKQTSKLRIKAKTPTELYSDEGKGFIQNNTVLEASDLSKKTFIQYKRVTFCNNKFTEKVTIDVELASRHNGSSVWFDNMAIIELKTEKNAKNDGLIRKLNSLGIRRSSFSKYCIGLAKNPAFNFKRNNFNLTIRKINKILAA